MKSLFICFMGIDGAGKTTQARHLVVRMKERGFATKYLYIKFEPWLIKPAVMVSKALFLKGKDMFKDYREYSSAKKELFRNRTIAVIYHYLLLLECIIRYTVKIWPNLLLRQSIVCDRFVYDVVVMLAADLGYSADRARTLSRILLNLLPKPDRAFLIDLPEEIAYKRKTDIPSLDFLKERRWLYLLVAGECDAIILDGTKNLAKLEDEIQESLRSLIGGF